MAWGCSGPLSSFAFKGWGLRTSRCSIREALKWLPIITNQCQGSSYLGARASPPALVFGFLRKLREQAGMPALPDNTPRKMRKLTEETILPTVRGQVSSKLNVNVCSPGICVRSTSVSSVSFKLDLRLIEAEHPFWSRLNDSVS